MNTFSLKRIQILLAAMLISIFSCSQEKKRPAEITWDSWGVPHIYASDEDQLFYAQGWAQMHLHGDLILSLFGRARGRAAEYWGKDQEMEATLIHTLGFPALAKTWSEKQDPRLKKIITAFAKGMNDYATQHTGSIQEDKKIVLPIVYDDIN
ncbi:MAG: acylase, partial [Marivirga sp.]|nr:acylase [Marivirga sp.]